MQKQLKLDDIRLAALAFRTNVWELEEWPDLKIDLDVKVVRYEKDPQQIVVVMELTIGDVFKMESNHPFDLFLRYCGFFSLSGDFPDEEVKQLGGVNCAAIMYPFLREKVHELVGNAINKSLLLPPINFVRFFQEKGVKVVKISSSEDKEVVFPEKMN